MAFVTILFILTGIIGVNITYLDFAKQKFKQYFLKIGKDMDNKKEEICRLCLHQVDASNYMLIEQIHKEILDVLLINIDIDEQTQSVLCKDCLEKLLDSFSFKSVCLYTEDNIIPLVHDQNDTKLDILNIFQKINDVPSNLSLKDQKICRFCVRIVEKVSYFPLMDLNEGILEKLKKYIPEMLLEAVEEPIICETCLYCLQDFFNFIDICVNVVERHPRKDSVTCDSQTESTDLDGRDGNKKNNNDYFTLLETSTKKRSAPSNKNGGLMLKEERKRNHKSPKNCQGKNIKMYKCQYCPHQTKYKQQFQKHVLTHEEDSFNLKKIKCQLCNFRTRSTGSLKHHMYSHETSNSVYYRCNTCPFKSKYKESLRYHLVIHQDVPLMKCPSCEYQTKHSRSLNAHKLTHQKEKTHTCGQCGFQTTQKAYLAIHVRRHTGNTSDETYKCDLCAYNSPKLKNLKKHKETHQQPSEMFSCELCPFASRYRLSLSRHQKIHEDPSRVPMFKCDSCSFQTKYKSGLRTHASLHSETANIYKCSVCDYTSTCLGSVRNHQKKHKGECEMQTFECDKCGFRTHNKTGLKNHVVIHMDVFYSCKFCDYRTKHKRNLPGHYKMVHGKKNVKDRAERSRTFYQK